MTTEIFRRLTFTSSFHYTPPVFFVRMSWSLQNLLLNRFGSKTSDRMTVFLRKLVFLRSCGKVTFQHDLSCGKYHTILLYCTISTLPHDFCNYDRINIKCQIHIISFWSRWYILLKQIVR